MLCQNAETLHTHMRYVKHNLCLSTVLYCVFVLLCVISINVKPTCENHPLQTLILASQLC